MTLDLTFPPQVLSSHTLLDNIYPNKVEDAYYCGGSNDTMMPTIYGEAMTNEDNDNDDACS